MFLLHREQCFFLWPRQQSVSYAQETVFVLLRQKSVSSAQGIVFLSLAKTTKCFLSQCYYYTVYKCLNIVNIM